MSSDLNLIADNLYKKVVETIALVNSSLKNLESYNPEFEYSPEESMPYDALSGRFIRSVEMCTKFFRVYERIILGDSSDTFRQLLNNMCKLDLISSVDLWIDMKDVRNRIVHDYLPDETKEIFDDIMSKYCTELNRLLQKTALQL
jgi:hypothetical protein